MTAQFLFVPPGNKTPWIPSEAAKLVKSKGVEKLSLTLVPRIVQRLEPPPARTFAEFDAHSGCITLRSDCILLMIGITKELVSGIKAAAREDFTSIRSCRFYPRARDPGRYDEEVPNLFHWYVRVRTLRGKVETLVAIAAKDYWMDAAGYSTKPTRGWLWLSGDHLDYCSLKDKKTGNLRQTPYLLEMVGSCQGQNESITVDA